MNIIEKRTAEIIPYANNPRNNETAVDAVAASIAEFGFKQPIVIDKKNVVVAGHTRLMAAKKLKLETVPCVMADDLTEAQVKAYRLADNKVGELATWDFEKLELEMNDLDMDMEQFGFESIGETSEEQIEEDEVPDVPEEPTAKVGDLYQLGEHRLICGDSTDTNVIDRLMGGAKAEILLTDPPYGISVVKRNEVGGDGALHFKGLVHGRGGKNRIIESSEYLPVIGDETTDTARESYDVSVIYSNNQIIFGGNYFTDFLKPSRCWIVWDKQNTGNFADAELAWTSFDKGVKLYHFLWNGLCREGSREVEGKTRVHPTQKPVGMLADILKDFTSENDTVLDLFGGSGSTLMACEQLKRKCFMCELEPHYVDVIIKRWENLTGNKAVLLNE